MKSTRETIKDFLWNIIASRLSDKEDVEFWSKVVLLNIITLFGIFFLSTLGTVAFIEGNTILGIVDFSIDAIMLIMFLLLRNTQRFTIISYISAIILTVFFMFLFCYGGVNRTAFLWFYTYPLIMVFIMGKKAGSILSLTLAVLSLLTQVFSKTCNFAIKYPVDLLIRFYASFFAVFMFAYFCEYVRKITSDKERKANIDLRISYNQLDEARKRLEELSITDALTGLYNRRYFEEVIELTYKQSLRSGGQMAFMMLDIDYFKLYNDRYGHIAGDSVLKQFSDIINSVM